MPITKDFTGTTQTANGTPTRNIKWNNIPNCYLGQIWDEAKNEWRTHEWSKTGKSKRGLAEAKL